MATHSSIPDWEIPLTEEPGGLQSMGLQKSWTWLETKHHHQHFPTKVHIKYITNNLSTKILFLGLPRLFTIIPILNDRLIFVFDTGFFFFSFF